MIPFDSTIPEPGTKRPISADDYWNIRYITDLQTAPDDTTAFVVRSVCEERNERRSAIWLLSGDGTQRTCVSTAAAYDEHPRWSPDGTRLALVSAATREAPRRIFSIDTQTLERRRLVHGSGTAYAPAWSPAGDAVCFVGEVSANGMRVAAESEWLRAHPEATGDTRLRRLTSAQSRVDGVGYRDRRAQLFIASLAPNAAPVRLTDGDGDDVEPAWSPDGRSIAFVSNRTTDGRVLSERNVWIVDVDSGALRRLTTGFWLDGPLAWSPDGTRIACLGLERLSVPLAIRLWLIAADGSGAVAGSDGLGAHLWPGGAPVWTTSGQRVLVAGGVANAGALLAYDCRTSTTSVLLQTEAVFGLVRGLSDAGTFLAVASTPASPATLVKGSLAGGVLEPLVDVNADWLAGVTVAPTRPVACTSTDGLSINGWLVAPPGPGPHPCVLDVHYGPNAAWGPAFALGAQALAAQGVATLFLNPRGSTGYGDDFAAAADYGGSDYTDLLCGLDALIAAGEIDAGRLGIMGLSYGGFMATWAITQTQRFRAAVSINGISNQLTWYLLSDTGLFFYERTFGDPFADPARLAAYWQHSPLAHVANVATPLLLVQSEADLRCPIDQGEQFFGALVAAGKVVEMIRVPDASHDLMGTAAPLHAYLAQRAIVDWFVRFVGASAPAAETAAAARAANGPLRRGAPPGETV